MPYTYDPRTGRYRSPSGRLVSEREIHLDVGRLTDASAERMAAMAGQLNDGTMSLAQFQVGMMAEIKTTHLAAAMVAHGGVEMMSAADYGFAGSLIKSQYRYLRTWCQDIAGGTASLAKLGSRAKLYAVSAFATFDAVRVRDARNSGAEMEERNVLSHADHCHECPALPSGWVPLGSLPPIGSRACKMNDRCRIERRIKARRAAA